MKQLLIQFDSIRSVMILILLDPVQMVRALLYRYYYHRYCYCVVGHSWRRQIVFAVEFD
jgi:hypothetical protein